MIKKGEKDVEGSGVENTAKKTIHVFLSPYPKIFIGKHHVLLDEKGAGENNTDPETSVYDVYESLRKEIIDKDEIMSLAGVTLPNLHPSTHQVFV